MTISEQDAVATARRLAEERGWRWEEPVHVSRRRSLVLFGRVSYEIRTNADRRGCNVRVVLDADDGTVVEAHWLPR